MAQRILEQARPVTSELDRMIFQMETTLGKPHSVSPFDGLYAKHLKVAAKTEAAGSAEEVKKAPSAQQAAAQDGGADGAQKKQKGKKQKQAANNEEGGAAAASKGGQKQPRGGAKAPADPFADLPSELKTFTQCDIRVGKIVECERHPESEKLYIEKIDLGEGKLRTIVSGLQPFITMEDMLADKILVFANMKARKLAGILSEGMVLCAGNEDHTQVEFVRPHNDTPIGERVSLEGSPFGEAPLPQEFCPILNPKRKIEPAFLENLKTSADCEGLYAGKKMVTKAGPVTAKTLANCLIK